LYDLPTACIMFKD